MLALLFEIVAVLIACFITPFIAGVVHASGIYEVGVLLILVFIIKFILGAIPFRRG